MNQYKTGPWLVVVAAMLWAVDAPFRKFLTADLRSTTIVLMEHLVIAVLVVIFLFRYLPELRKLRHFEWWAVVFIGLGGSALATVMFTQSFHYLNPSVAILLQKVQPFIAILLAVWLLREKLGKTFWLWALLGVFGAYLVSFPDFKIGSVAGSPNALGVLLALGAAFFWGGSTVMGRVVLSRVSFQAMTAVRFLSALLFLVLIELFTGRISEVAGASPKDWLYVLIIAVVAGFVSLFIYYRGLTHTKASVATLGELAFPVAAVIVNWKFLGAALEPTQIVGGLILLAATIGLSYFNAASSWEYEAKEIPV
ncbi:MAG: DMT family transporter [Candidatus Doudnabacteria bacterium]|nr:DMT family transporter [Candidatus Doudnabacteria bacterium]